MIHKGSNFITSVWKGSEFVRSVWKGHVLVYPHCGLQYASAVYGYNQVGIYYQEQATSVLYQKNMTRVPNSNAHSFLSATLGYSNNPYMWVYDAYVYNPTGSTQTSEIRLWNVTVYGVPTSYVASRSLSLASQTGTQLRIFSEPLYGLFTTHTHPYVTWLWTSTVFDISDLYTALNPLS